MNSIYNVITYVHEENNEGSVIYGLWHFDHGMQEIENRFRDAWFVELSLVPG